MSLSSGGVYGTGYAETVVLVYKQGTDATSYHEGVSNLIGSEHLLKTLRDLQSIWALTGVNSQGVKDGGVSHPSKN